jgi:hypothetical protein
LVPEEGEPALPQADSLELGRLGDHLSDTAPSHPVSKVSSSLLPSATGGGQIVYGVTDAGAINNGVIARSVKGQQSTKEWLEDVVPTLTDFEMDIGDMRAKGSSLLLPSVL